MCMRLSAQIILADTQTNLDEDELSARWPTSALDNSRDRDGELMGLSRALDLRRNRAKFSGYEVGSARRSRASRLAGDDTLANCLPVACSSCLPLATASTARFEAGRAEQQSRVRFQLAYNKRWSEIRIFSKYRALFQLMRSLVYHLLSQDWLQKKWWSDKNCNCALCCAHKGEGRSASNCCSLTIAGLIIFLTTPRQENKGYLLMIDELTVAPSKWYSGKGARQSRNFTSVGDKSSMQIQTLTIQSAWGNWIFLLKAIPLNNMSWTLTARRAFRFEQQQSLLIQ